MLAASQFVRLARACGLDRAGAVFALPHCAAAVPLGAVAGGFPRFDRRRLYFRRRLLGVYQGALEPVSLRLLSGKRALARLAVVPRHYSGDFPRAVVLRGKKTPVGALVRAARSTGAVVVFAARRRFRFAGSAAKPLGRDDADAGGRLRWAAVFPAVRHFAGARPHLRHAVLARRLRRFYRAVARRAAGNGALYGKRHATAVPAAVLAYRQPDARADWRRPLCLGLYGRGGARRPASDSARPV